MTEKIKKLLPIGTVVSLKDGSKKLMVFGIIQSIMNEDNGQSDHEFDYIGVPYPEGNMGQEYQFLFNHDDIEQVYFRGFEDVERQEFIFNLIQFYKDKKE